MNKFLSKGDLGKKSGANLVIFIYNKKKNISLRLR